MKFKILKRQEIVDTINIILDQDNYKQWNINLTTDDLLSPKPLRVQQVYRLLLEVMYSGANERMAQRSFMPESVEHPGIYDDGSHRVKLICAVRKALNTCGCDFEVHDLFEPTSKRTVRNFSGIINFLKFQTYILSQLNYDTHWSGKDTVMDRNEELRLENEELDIKLRKFEHLRAQEEETVSELKAKCEQEDKEMALIKQQEGDLHSEMDLLFEQIKSNSEKAANLEGQFKLLEEASKDLSRKVVTCSPTELREEVEEARKRATQASEHYKGTDSSVSDFMNLTKTMEKLPPVLRQVSSSVDVLMKKEEKLCSEGQTSVNKFDEKITIQQRALKELNQQLKSLNGRMKSVDQRLHQVSLKNKKNGMSNPTRQSELDIVRLEKEKLESENAKSLQAVEELHLQMSALENKHTSRMSQIQEAKVELEQAVKNRITAYSKVFSVDI